MAKAKKPPQVKLKDLLRLLGEHFDSELHVMIASDAEGNEFREIDEVTIEEIDGKDTAVIWPI